MLAQRVWPSTTTSASRRRARGAAAASSAMAARSARCCRPARRSRPRPCRRSRQPSPQTRTAPEAKSGSPPRSPPGRRPRSVRSRPWSRTSRCSPAESRPRTSRRSRAGERLLDRQEARRSRRGRGLDPPGDRRLGPRSRSRCSAHSASWQRISAALSTSTSRAPPRRRTRSSRASISSNRPATPRLARGARPQAGLVQQRRHPVGRPAAGRRRPRAARPRRPAGVDEVAGALQVHGLQRLDRRPRLRRATQNAWACSAASARTMAMIPHMVALPSCRTRQGYRTAPTPPPRPRRAGLHGVGAPRNPPSTVGSGSRPGRSAEGREAHEREQDRAHERERRERLLAAQST